MGVIELPCAYEKKYMKKNKPTIEEGKKKGSFIFWPNGKPTRIRAPKEKYVIWRGEKIELKSRLNK